MDETVIYLIRSSEICHRKNFNFISDKSNKLIKENAFLSVEGEKKAEKLSQIAELQDIDAVYSSDYIRSLSTAKYIANQNNTVINVDARLNERKVGELGNMSKIEFNRLQKNDFDFKMPKGESINETKKRMVDSMKNILMFEAGNKVAVVSHSTSLTCLLSAWCDVGRNYDNDVILSYKDETIVDSEWTAPMIFKVVFDGMNVKDIEIIPLKNL